jgi:hypothetical protein
MYTSSRVTEFQGLGVVGGGRGGGGPGSGTFPGILGAPRAPADFFGLGAERLDRTTGGQHDIWYRSWGRGFGGFGSGPDYGGDITVKEFVEGTGYVAGDPATRLLYSQLRWAMNDLAVALGLSGLPVGESVDYVLNAQVSDLAVVLLSTMNNEYLKLAGLDHLNAGSLEDLANLPLTYRDAFRDWIPAAKAAATYVRQQQEHKTSVVTAWIVSGILGAAVLGMAGYMITRKPKAFAMSGWGDSCSDW